MLSFIYMNNLRERLELAKKDTEFDGKGGYTRLAAAVGVTRALVTMWFNGKVENMAGSNLIKVAVALNVDPNWLETGVGEMRPKVIRNHGDLAHILAAWHILPPEKQKQLRDQMITEIETAKMYMRHAGKLPNPVEDEVVIQKFEKTARHRAPAHKMVKKGIKK